jgi:DNA-binding LacI/PurR family transcriptional regulator
MPQAWLQVPVYVDVLHGVETALRERDLGMLLHHVATESDFGAGTLRGIVDGLLLLGRRAEEFGSAVRRFPCVRIMGSLEEEDWCDHVTYRNGLIGRLAAQHLLQRGHRNCAYLGPAEARGIWEERARTFCDAVAAAGGTASVLQQDGLFGSGGGDPSADRERMANLVDRLLAHKPRPTGVFLPADALTAAACFILLERGVRPGTDVELVSCNNEQPLLAALRPRPAVVDIHAQEVGRRAVEHLLWRLEHPQAHRTSVQIDPSLA